MTFNKILAATLTAAVLASSVSMANAATSSSTIATGAKTPVVRSAKSIACSAQADAKNLHGKERKTFRKACLKAA